MTVFVVTAVDYEDFNVDAVFATREKAVAYIEEKKAKQKRARRPATYDYDIVEHEVIE